MNMSQDVEDFFQSNILSTIISDIDRIHVGSDGLIDALIHYCEERNIDPEEFGKFVKRTPAIKSKLQEEAEQLGILEKTSRLPI